ncbi:MAG: threonine-phosphate decarboxylase [Deltaproteobacteria bacterium]|nr:threonine-phosphate decarboxylase [Deltaproteobacteria bacterium]MBW2119653.1 threonine-phosphate decarboxylase [Deltaproteobacteria bacterium]MBW2343849.1 threonine-phosphate decarboxylase [Deltaproteobacteria bacterium]
MNNSLQYRHGGSPSLDLARFNLADRAVLDFSVNLNPLGPPEIVKQKWAETLEAISDYPSVEGNGVSHYYKKKIGIPSQNFLAGNGSTELIYLIPRTLRLKRFLVITPSYNDYERASVLAGSEVTRVPLSPDAGFSFPDMNDLIDALNNSDGLWLGRPNNPTGNLFPKRQLLELADRFPDHLFIIDEAFIQFTDMWTESSLMTEKVRPNILVVHSLTKFYALAGLRVGGVVGHSKLISRLKQAKEPWTVNGIADRVAPLLLECTDYEHRTRHDAAMERKRVSKKLEQVDGIIPYPCSANFILCRWTRTEDMDDLVHYLLENSAYVRDCRNFPGLENNFFRIGLRSPNDNDKLMSILSSFPYA